MKNWEQMKWVCLSTSVSVSLFFTQTEEISVELATKFLKLSHEVKIFMQRSQQNKNGKNLPIQESLIDKGIILRTITTGSIVQENLSNYKILRIVILISRFSVYQQVHTNSGKYLWMFMQSVEFNIFWPNK